MIRLSELCVSYSIRLYVLRHLRSLTLIALHVHGVNFTEEGGFTTTVFGEIRGEGFWGSTSTVTGWLCHHCDWRLEYGITFSVTLYSSDY